MCQEFKPLQYEWDKRGKNTERKAQLIWKSSYTGIIFVQKQKNKKPHIKLRIGKNEV